MTLEDLWKLTRRHIIAIVLCAALGLVTSFLWMILQDEVYTANSSGYVTAGGGQSISESFSSQTLAQQKAKAYVTLFTNRNVTEAVVKELKLDATPSELANRITATLPADGVTIEVTAEAGTPAQARDIADAVVKAAAAEAKKMEQAGPTRTAVGANGETQEIESRAQVVIVPSESAVLPKAPSFPQPQRILPIGLILGLLVGYAIAAVRHRNDTKVRRVEDVERITESGVLGILPDSQDLGSEPGDASKPKAFHEREALRKLRTNLRFVDVDHQPRCIVVTSSKQGEGKSTVACNLATVLAESGERVVLIDADMRRSAVARAFDLDGSVGLSQVLAGDVGVWDAVQPTTTPGLDVLASGTVPPNPTELLGSHRMERLMNELSRDHYVILDAPPLLPVTDAALLTRVADGAVLVVAAGKTHREELERSVQSLNHVDGKILGAILNRVSTRAVDRLRYGDVAYGYSSVYESDYVPTDETTSRRDLRESRRRR